MNQRVDKIPVLYLRHGAGSGGGADTIILNTAPLVNQTRFPIIIAYLRKHTENLDAVYQALAKRGFSCLDFPGSSFFDLRQFLDIARVIRENGIRLVHCHDPKSDQYGYLLRFLFPEIKLVSSVHGWVIRRARSRFYVAIDRWLLRRFDAVIAVSDEILKTAARRGIKNIYLIRNSVDAGKWRRTVDRNTLNNAEAPRIGYAARISKEKGPLDFVRVAQKVALKYPRAEFHVAGRGPEEDEMKALVRQLGIEKCFHFAGHLDENSVRSFYQNLHVLLLTSYSEGIPLTVLEALAMEIPVVATRVGGVGEAIETGINGLLAEAGDVESLANHVMRVLNDGGWARGLGAAGRQTVENNFSLAVCAKKIEEVYEKTVTSPASS